MSTTSGSYRCNQCPDPATAFRVPAPLDELGVALMQAHLDEHATAPTTEPTTEPTN